MCVNYESFSESYNRIMSLLGISEVKCLGEVVGRIAKMVPDDLRNSLLFDVVSANPEEEWNVLFEWVDNYFFGGAILDEKVNVR